MLTQKEGNPGGLIGEKERADLTRERRANVNAERRTNANRWFFVAVASLTLNCFTTFGWHQADKRFAENVRVAYVKMTPNGTTSTEFADEEKPVDFFQATVDSKLTEWVEKRYSKRRATISYDYGFAELMMSNEMKTDFEDNKKAVDLAATFAACAECAQVFTKIRNINSLDKDLQLSSKKQMQYNTLVFVTQQTKDRTGKVTGCQNQIITLLWKFRTKAETSKRRAELQYNPLGQEIIDSTVRNDPTTVSDKDCKNL